MAMEVDWKGRPAPEPCGHGVAGWGLEDMTQDGSKQFWFNDCNMCLHRGMPRVGYVEEDKKDAAT